MKTTADKAGDKPVGVTNLPQKRLALAQRDCAASEIV
jgi:hypothetical protein